MIHNWFRIARVLVPLIAGCALLVSLIATVLTVDFLRDAKSTTGTIVDVNTTTNDDGEQLYQPTFTFVVDGRDYSASAFGHTAPSPGDLGDAVKVLYDPQRPTNARLDSFTYTWLIPLATFMLACVFGMIHLALAWFGRNYRYIGADGG